MLLKHKLMMSLAALSLLGLFFFPMWNIQLEAPQYPKGSELGINIHINSIKGAKPNDLGNINNLNHYIGMKTIEADDIPELVYMPWIVVGFTVLGLLIVAINKRQLIIVWLLMLIGTGALGMYDFYLWEYDYGHNLDPHAIIKIEGMSYQPPLFGTEQLLNFTASSYPAIGFGFIILSAALSAAAWLMSRKVKPSVTT